MKKPILNYTLIIFLAFCCLLSILLSCKSRKSPNCDAYGTINSKANSDSISVTKDDVNYLNDIPSN